jgi:hypothetical protein
LTKIKSIIRWHFVPLALMFWLAANSECFAAGPIEGDCLPTGDKNKTWNCQYTPNDVMVTGRQIVSCDRPEPSALDEGWFRTGSFSQTHHFILNKLHELGLNGFVKWSACQGLKTSLDSYVSKPEHRVTLRQVTVSVYGARDARLKSMTNNWYWWCAEGKWALLTELISGCFVPSYFEFDIVFEKNGEVRTVTSGTSLDN